MSIEKIPTRMADCAECGKRGRTQRMTGVYRCSRCEPQTNRTQHDPIELEGGRWVLVRGVWRWVVEQRQDVAA